MAAQSFMRRWTLTAASSHCSTNALGADYIAFQTAPCLKGIYVNDGACVFTGRPGVINVRH
jgi:hypothetical protein